MGISLSILASSWKEILNYDIFGLTNNEEEVIVRSISFNERDGGMTLRNFSFKKNNMENTLKNDGCDENDSEIMVRSFSFRRRDGEVTVRNLSFKKKDMENNLKSDGSDDMIIEKLMSFKNWEPIKQKADIDVSFKKLVLDSKNFGSVNLINKDEGSVRRSTPTASFPDPEIMFSPKPLSELDAAAVKVQKVYKSYRTRRNLADCAVLVEELWWKALDSAALKQSSVTYFNTDKHETAISRWARARTRAAKVGKGLSKDEKAQKLALQHWLEAIDPRHRYGHNLHFYYDLWFDSGSPQPFFYWLDIGDGKEVTVGKCPRNVLQRQCIEYLGPNKRVSYEVVVESGKLVYKQSGELVNTVEGSKWIFVLSTSRSLYVGQKKKGVFQHSSFLSGGATTAAGRLVAHEGVLEAIWPYSGHYLPTEENFKEFISFLEERHVDLTNVKRCAADEDSPSTSFKVNEEEEPKSEAEAVECPTTTLPSDDSSASEVIKSAESITPAIDHKENNKKIDLGKRLSCKWSTGTGPRIGCVSDYPPELRFRALEQVNLSPRVTPGPFWNSGPIPSPRPSPKVRLSPRLSYMGHPSPRSRIQ